MPEYVTPGLYYELVDTAPPSVRGLRTDIAAFIGLAPRGPLHTPTRIESWRRYQSLFGSFVTYGYLAYTVKAFLENGGQTCFVVRVAGADAAAATLLLSDSVGAPLLRIRARNEGTWGNGLRVTLLSVSASRDSFSLAVIGPGNDREVYRDLSLAEGHPRNCSVLLADGDDVLPPSRWIYADVEPSVTTGSLPDATASGLILSSGLLTGGADGLASLTRDDFLGTLDDADAGKRGLGSLEAIGDVAIVCMPDIHIVPEPAPVQPVLPSPPPIDICLPCTRVARPIAAASDTAGEMPPRFSDADIETMQHALIEHCKSRGDRVAILDAPVTMFGSPFSPSEILAWRSLFDSERGFAALYYPWVEVLDPIATGGRTVRAVPPCGHVAGLYARTDIEVGVHKAPANGEARWAENVTVEVEPDLQGMLNPEGVNCLRAFPGRGIRVYGARTVSSDPAWRYINVRRLLLMIEKAVDLSTQWAVFEPHDEVLRLKIVRSIGAFLETIWRQGMLAGAVAEDAFYVKCDLVTNPPGSVDAGKIIAEIGVAPAIPAEFVVIRVGRTAAELEVVER